MLGIRYFGPCDRIIGPPCSGAEALNRRQPHSLSVIQALGGSQGNCYDG